MTPMDKDALRKMIEAVERGERWAEWGAVDCPLGLASIYARNAFNGSLDAAKELHEALTPEWRFESFSLNGEVVLLRNRPIDSQYGFVDMDPARAWLLAILKAVEAQP